MRCNLALHILELSAKFASKFSRKGTVHGLKRGDLLEENLRIVLKREPSQDEIKNIFYFHVLYHLYLLTYLLVKDKIRVVPESKEALDSFIEETRNRGTICVSAHIGVPEFASTLYKEIKIFALVERLESKFQRAFFNLSRKAIGVNTVESFREFVRHMKEPKGKSFILLVDRPIPNSKSTYMFEDRFFISDLPFRLSKRFNLSVFGMFCYRVYLYNPGMCEDIFNLRLQRLGCFDEMVRFLETIIRERYEQWNPFFRRIFQS